MKVLDFIDGLNKKSINEIRAFRRLVSREVPDACSRDFFNYRFHNPFFGYVEIQNDGCDPFYMFTNNDDVVAQQYLWYGKNGYCPASVREWISVCKKSTTVIDVGAYTGLFSLLAYFSGESVQKIIAIEPLIRAYSRIFENLIANGLISKVVVERFLIAERSGKRHLFIPGDDYQISVASSYLTNDDEELIEREEWCDALTLDELVGKYDLLPDLIKLKMGGAELDGVSGAEKIIDLGTTTFFIEILPVYFDKIKRYFAKYDLLFANDTDNTLSTIDNAGPSTSGILIAKPKGR